MDNEDDSRIGRGRHHRKEKKGRRDKGGRKGIDGPETRRRATDSRGLGPDWIGKVAQDFGSSEVSSSVQEDTLDFASSVGVASASIDFFCVLDFEATCDDKGRIPKKESEIIEFPSVLLDVRKGVKKASVVAEFQRYCKPVLHSELTPFCTDLTGITQATVDGGVGFRAALAGHSRWLASYLTEPDGTPLYTAAIVTCGSWDLQTCLPNQLDLLGVPPDEIPDVYHRWINLKDVFKQVTQKSGGGMKGMLRELGLPLVGRHHSGIDDCRNTCNLLLHLMRAGALPERNLVCRFPETSKVAANVGEARIEEQQTTNPTAIPERNLACRLPERSNAAASIGEARIEEQQKTNPTIKTPRKGGGHCKPTEGKRKLRTAGDVLSRLRWCPLPDTNEEGEEEENDNVVMVGYDDRINGPMEMPVGDFVPIAKGGDIPEHRILYFRRTSVVNPNTDPGRIVWDRAGKVDCIFGSGNGAHAPIAQETTDAAKAAMANMITLEAENEERLALEAMERARQARKYVRMEFS